jgi:hypothetical protein
MIGDSGKKCAKNTVAMPYHTETLNSWFFVYVGWLHARFVGLGSAEHGPAM